MTMSEPRDQQARARALDPHTSFIVQAPAGSGKTGLLTQRYLVLLAGVENPEEIVAITFTRKAAGEMRERILMALQAANTDQPPQAAHELKTWELAREALRRDQEKGWCLLENPGRLRIKTIDSMGTDLARQMPLLSEFGAVPAIAEDAFPLYQEAAQSALSQLEAGDAWSESLIRLMRHRDNRLDDLQGLIAEMLARRDQWLRHVADPDHPQLRREEIEPVLRELVEESLEHLVECTPGTVREALPELCRFAANILPEGSMLEACRNLQSIPGASLEDLEAWTGIADLLMTKGKADDRPWRKSVTKAQGFPVEKDGQDPEEKARFKEMKGRMQELLHGLVDEEPFRRALGRLSILPNPAYSDEEWSVLEALFRVLLFSAAQLKGVFSNQGQVDFIEVAMRANQALGSEDNPTELAMRLDYQIRHLLVDEFQDTSQNQFDLFRRLTAGWQPGDGRSLFLVGDPMQSIYRFREAEVGLFLDAWERGLGDIPLEPLGLSVNFRSQQGIIDWVNDQFRVILPRQNDKASGAVCYAPSDASKPALRGEAVTVHAFTPRDDEAESQQVIDIIQKALQEQSDQKIAILARNRSHLADIVGLLKEQGILFQAVEIESLGQRPVVQDLLALSRAMIHSGDRIAWLAVLRAPFVGLCLADLHALVAAHPRTTVYEMLNRPECIAELSGDGQRRIARILPVLNAGMRERDRRPLREWVGGMWIALGGPACVHDENDLMDAVVFFQLLGTLGEGQEEVDPELMQQKVEGLFALPDVNAGEALQLMTIHKAKGLEFDTVIVPGLGRTPRRDNTRLLYWLERTGKTGRPELIFGPIRSAWEDSNRTADYIKRLESEKGQYEDGRLLYVAATRARKRLHLMGAVSVRTDGSLGEPASASLLARLWPVVKSVFTTLHESKGRASEELEQQELPIESKPPRLRLISDWHCPEPPAGIHAPVITDESAEEEGPVEFDWAGETARHIGTVVHRILQYLGSSDQQLDEAYEKMSIREISRQLLGLAGVSSEQMDASVERVRIAVKNTVEDEYGRWMLSHEHQAIQSEYPLTGVINGQLRRMVIDRTFVDENDVRWIIDYKTSAHEGGGVEAFLDREVERYRLQLDRYARAFRMLESREVRTGLYFPLLQAWREVA
jgi:ATP-dependent exoDNAse (exonuclease V) beta subunit